ncbi:MAG TPA: hypothetical protein VH247_03135 [Thermoleophilaceae bacterium]|nr:hypothetical protein [Thermoleophilaceae bacterium]
MAAILMAVLVPLAFAIAPRAVADDQPTATASVVKVDSRKAPRTKVVHHRFRPWAHPTPGQVREIIRNEARRWGISAASLNRRVACESRYHWWASNGQYQGVLQFGANAFYRGLHSMRTYKVKLVRSTTRKVHDRRVTHYSDGRKVSRRTTPRRQRLVVVYNGRIPRRPSMSNAYAQIRIGAQAIRGISAVRSSEWSCSA